MITDHLPRYREAHPVRPTYEIRRSIMIDGHEVAWMRRTNGAKRYGLYCECYFTEGVGWYLDDDYGLIGMAGRYDCIYYKTAIDLRMRELHQEYAERFIGRRTAESADLVPYLDELVADLLERGGHGEFIGEGVRSVELISTLRRSRRSWASVTPTLYLASKRCAAAARFR